MVRFLGEYYTHPVPSCVALQPASSLAKQGSNQMKLRTIVTAALAAAIAASASAQAPSWSAQQTAVWNVVSQSWADEVARNGRWPSSYVHDRVVAWDSSWPLPRYKASLEKWTRFQDKQRQTLEYEIAPAAITIAGDTAVVHYTGVSMSQRAQDKREREMFAAVETLVRSGGAWKFLSVTGFDLKKDD
jgi:hypothetical protein